MSKIWDSLKSLFTSSPSPTANNQLLNGINANGLSFGPRAGDIRIRRDGGMYVVEIYEIVDRRYRKDGGHDWVNSIDAASCCNYPTYSSSIRTAAWSDTFNQCNNVLATGGLEFDDVEHAKYFINRLFYYKSEDKKKQELWAIAKKKEEEAEKIQKQKEEREQAERHRHDGVVLNIRRR